MKPQYIQIVLLKTIIASTYIVCNCRVVISMIWVVEIGGHDRDKSTEFVSAIVTKNIIDPFVESFFFGL